MFKDKNSFAFTASLLMLFSTNLFAQQKFQASTVAFYNVENLFDTKITADYIDGTRSYSDPLYHISIDVNDIPKYDTVMFKGPYTYEAIEGKKIIRPLILQEDEFSPNGKKFWTEERYRLKLKRLSEVISQLGKEETQTAPVIVGLSEVETFQTVQDLADQPALKPFNYGVIHFNSFDARGIDVALIYQKDRFQVTIAKPYPVEIRSIDGQKSYTRDILRVSGLLDGEPFTFLVNHWPSRSGGEERSRPNRIRAAKVMKSIFDEVTALNPNEKIIAMGDFNDDPVSPSIKIEMATIGQKEDIKPGDIYNPMERMFKEGQGTLAYRDVWNLFDQFLMSSTLVENDKKFESYKVYKTGIFNPPYLRTKSGPYKGYPHRMYGGDTFHSDGYSDHFPIYTILLRTIN